MADKLSVLNLTLAHLGEEPTASPDVTADSSGAARKALLQFDQACDAVLSRHGWLCALEYDTLQPLADGGDWRWPAWFELPADCLRVWEAQVSAGLSDGLAVVYADAGVLVRAGDWLAGPWEFGTRTLDSGAVRQIIRAASSDPIDVAYVRRAPIEAFPPPLVDALALEAAARACGPITGDLAKAQAFAARAEQALRLAVGQDGTQQRGTQDLQGWSTSARLRASAG